MRGKENYNCLNVVPIEIPLSECLKQDVPWQSKKRRGRQSTSPGELRIERLTG